MITFPLSVIAAAARHRPAGYYEDVLASGTVEGDSVVLEDAVYDRLSLKYQAAQPRERWPLWAKLIEKRRCAADVGVGDTVARCLAAVGASDLSAWMKREMGVECGCAFRQERLNVMYPYKSVLKIIQHFGAD